MNITLSKIDHERFGVVTAKASIEKLDEVTEALSWCKERNVEMMIVRTATTDIRLAQGLEGHGFFLTDTLVYFQKKPVDTVAPPLPEGYSWRLAEAGDADAVGSLASETFKGYSGHYHADARLSETDADLVYSSWAANSCREKSVADAVILVEHQGEIAAFATLKQLENDTFEGVLFGVSPAHQGKSLYAALMKLAQAWGAKRNANRMIVSTQITNLAVQKVWCRHGFEPLKSLYTFHYWLNSDSI